MTTGIRWTPPRPRGAVRPAFGLVTLAGASALLAACSSSIQPPASVAGTTSSTAASSAAPTPSLPVSAASVGCPAGGEGVGTAAELASALSAATPGTTIVLASGRYVGQFVAKVSGTQQSPITLCGPGDAVIDGGTIKLGYALHLDGASWWRLSGFSVTDGQKGVVTDHAHNDDIANLSVHDIGDEAVHLRSFSTNNVVEHLVIRHTGMLETKFGEGIYIGTARKNWCQWSSCGPDKSDDNVIRDNDIADTTAENVDVKEGTTGGTITGNTFSGDGLVDSAASAWVNVKGNGWTVTGNMGSHSNKDGLQVHEILSGWGRDNVFRGNTGDVGGPGYGIYVQHSSLQTVIACDNTVRGGSGVSNEGCS